jgi:sigma-B regulation protein RsbU (phosphoserine phosphatase)
MMIMRRDGKVLVVEESSVVTQAIEAAGELPYICDRATDGWDAIEKLETGSYAAIVIDTDMPRHSGFGVLNYLREEVGDDLGNVIVVTSSDRDELRRKLSDDKLTVARKSDALTELSRVMQRE